jgi:hypothetical protein
MTITYKPMKGPSSLPQGPKLTFGVRARLYGLYITTDVEISSPKDIIVIRVNNKNEDEPRVYELRNENALVYPVVDVHYEHKNIPCRKRFILFSNKSYSLEREEAREVWTILQRMGWRA